MTVASNTPYDQYSATAGQTVFNYTFEIVEQTDILVYQRGENDDPNDTTDLLVLNVDYTVAGVGNENGGTITLTSGATLNDVVTLKQNVPVERDTSFTNGGVLRAQDLNNEYDAQMLTQQVTRFNEQNRMLRYWDSAVLSAPRDLIIPVLEPTQIWRMNPAGDAIEAVETADVAIIGGSTGSVQWNNGGNLDGDSNFTYDGAGNVSINGSLAIDNLTFNGNTISSTDTDGDINLTPDGTGIVSVPTPTAGSSPTTKDYVDALAAGFNYFQPVRVATTANLSATYNNGASGVGATLTATANGAASIDSTSLALNDRVLFKNQTDQTENGIYYVSIVGDGSNPAVYTRTTDFDLPSEIEPGDVVVVLEGTENEGTKWIQTADVNTIGTDNIVWALNGNNPNNVVTIDGTQTITGQKSFNADITAPNKVSKNLIIGGDFNTNPWQRNVTFTGIGASQFTADRWVAGVSGAAVLTVQKTNNSPTVAQSGYFSGFCMEMVTTTADPSVGASDFVGFIQKIEGYNFAAIAQTTFTISFWVKSNITGTMGVSCRNSGADRSFVSLITINSANTWEKKTITVSPSPSAGTWNYVSGTGLQLTLTAMAGSTLQTSTTDSWLTGNFVTTSAQTNFVATNANYVRIALVQVEKGSIATPFEARTHEKEFSLCQRYYQKSYNDIGYPGATSSIGAIGFINYATTNSGGAVAFATRMRNTPTITLYSPSTGASGSIREAGTDRAASVINQGSYGFGIVTSTGLTVGGFAYFQFAASAEL